MRLWTRAAELAAQTPASRDRTVDFLRAISILVVIAGHWTAAAPHVDETGQLTPTHMLAVSAWTRWLTWGIQVMPIFFLVGGFSNGITWCAARRDGAGYAAWLEARLRRLIGPVLALVIAWILLGVAARLGGVRPVMIEVGSQLALIPIWFLAVYIAIVVLVPVTYAMWERWGLASIVLLGGAGVVVDVAFFVGDAQKLGWANYLFVWSAVHQLGYAWRDGRLSDPRRTIIMAVAGAAALVALVTWGPYPASMVGVPGQAVSNTTPPKITLLALALAQGGLLLTLQGPMRRWLARAVPWTATVLVNGMIMTIYLWHLTAMVLVIGLLFAVAPAPLRLDPGTGVWWATRPVWLAGLVVALVPLGLVFSRFERPGPLKGTTVPAAWRLVGGAVLVCAGLALLAMHGIGGAGWWGLRIEVLVLPFLGAAFLRRW